MTTRFGDGSARFPTVEARQAGVQLLGQRRHPPPIGRPKAIGRVIKTVTVPIYPVGDVLVWHTEGLKMVQFDVYQFPAGRLDWRLIFPSYQAANQLEFSGGFPDFSHEETWDDNFSGTWGTASGPAVPGI